MVLNKGFNIIPSKETFVQNYNSIKGRQKLMKNNLNYS